MKFTSLFFIWTKTDRIVLPLDYIKRRLVNMRMMQRLTQLQQVTDSLLDERHQYKNGERHFSGHSTQTADTWMTYFLNREQSASHGPISDGVYSKRR